MKTIFFCSLLLLFTNFIKAQDTIIMKSGVKIPAIILDKGDVEIKYKKFAQPEPAGIYSVFVSDVARIHYKNGASVDYNKINQAGINNQANQSANKNSSSPSMKFIVGVSINNLKRNTSDNLLLYWRGLNNNNTLNIGGNQQYYALNLGMGSTLDANKRNWFGASLQLVLTPSDAISASNTYNGGLNEIKLNAFYYNISLYYGHTINHKKTLILIFEPAVDLVMMNGYIKVDDTKYNVSSMGGFSSHFALGLDWNISRRFMASLRAGEQFVKIKESHTDSKSSTGYASFYVNYPTNQDLVNVNWSGSYFSFGISYSLYTHIRTGHQ
jgi:hypothetical protein